MKKTLLIFQFLMFSNLCFAEFRWHESEIRRIYPTADGGFVLTFKGNAQECAHSNAEKYHYVLDGHAGMTKDGANKMYALALSAAAMGKKVSINYDDSTPDCYINRMFVLYE